MRATVALSRDMRDNPCIGKRRPTGPRADWRRKLHALNLCDNAADFARTAAGHVARCWPWTCPSAASASPAPTTSAASQLRSRPSSGPDRRRTASGWPSWRASGRRSGWSIGLPINMDGSEGPMAKAMRAEAASAGRVPRACRPCCRTSGSRPSRSRTRSPRAACPAHARASRSTTMRPWSSSRTRYGASPVEQQPVAPASQPSSPSRKLMPSSEMRHRRLVHHGCARRGGSAGRCAARAASPAPAPTVPLAVAALPVKRSWAGRDTQACGVGRRQDDVRGARVDQEVDRRAVDHGLDDDSGRAASPATAMLFQPSATAAIGGGDGWCTAADRRQQAHPGQHQGSDQEQSHASGLAARICRDATVAEDEHRVNALPRLASPPRGHGQPLPRPLKGRGSRTQPRR